MIPGQSTAGIPSSSIARRSSVSSSPSVDPERSAHIGERPRKQLLVAQNRAAADGVAQEPRALVAGDAGVDDGEGLGEAGLAVGAGEHFRHGVVEQRARFQIVEHGEMRRYARFERRDVQEPLAEGVDRVDLEPARRLDGPGEQPTGEQQAFRAGAHALEVEQLVGEPGIVQRHPAPEPVEHTDRHVRRRRLGEGEAEDARGRHALQQQPQHAVGEHLGLARAGIGGDPGGDARLRGALLEMRDVGEDFDRCAHDSSPPVPPVADHSLTRARWS